MNSTLYASVYWTTGIDNVNVQFRNNIVIDETGRECIWLVNDDPDIIFSNNLYNKYYEPNAVGTGDIISTVSISKIGTFSDTTYYELLSASPARDGGTTIAEVTTDYLGVSRDALTDIGALEYTLAPLIEPLIVITTLIYAGSVNAICGGNVIDDGGGTVSRRGVCWSTSVNPTIADLYTSQGSGLGEFTSIITGLSPLTTYHVRAYATNEAETGYGEDIEFITLSSSGLKGNYMFHEGKILFAGDKVLIY